MTDSEMNEAIARKLGWTDREFGAGTLLMKGNLVGPRDYCHSIEAAWEIVEKIHNTVLFTLWWHDGDWEVDIETNDDEAIITKAPTATMAICLTFLKLP